MESDHLPLEMGVFEDFTTMSATSIIGIAFLLPRGGVGSVEGPGEGAENILQISTNLPRSINTHIQTASAIPSNRLSVLRFCKASCCCTADIFGLICSKLSWPTDEPSVADFPDRALIRSIIAWRRCSTEPGRMTLPLSGLSSRTKGSSSMAFLGIELSPGEASSFDDEATAKRLADGRAVEGPKWGRGSRGIGGIALRAEPLV